MTDHSGNPPVYFTLIKNAKYLPKVCAESNGIDLPLQSTVTFQPKENKKVNMGIRFKIPDKHCGLLMNKSSALPKYKVKIILGLIDVNYNGELIAVMENDSDKELILTEGTALCQLLIIPANVPILDNKWTEPVQSRGSFGSTGQEFKTINKKTGNDSHKKDTQINLLEMASDSKISATAYGIQVGDQSNILKCFAIDNPLLRQGLDRKVYFSAYINNTRVTACTDSGSDLTLMQERLFNKIFGKNTLLQNSIITDLRSYSDNVIKIKGQIVCPFYFKRNTPYINLTIIIIQDIPGSITPFLFGNDSLKACLATLAYTGNITNPLPELYINNPIREAVNTYYSSPSEIMSCQANYSLKAYETSHHIYVA